MRNLLILIVSMLLISCASTTKEITYYSLSLNQTVNTEDAAKKLVIIKPIRLAPFLQQQGLVMQIGEHQLVTANHHQWAESLQLSIAKLLQQGLNRNCKSYHFERVSKEWSIPAEFILELEIDKFHATDQSTIAVAGNYWFYQKDMQLKLSKNIMINDELQQDGYLHVVEKLEAAVLKLSKNICAAIE